MNWYSRTGRAGLIRDLMEKGFSVRKAEKGVNAVFACMTAALRRGESVEIPGGKYIHFPGARNIVKFTPDETLVLTPPPAPAPALPPEELECRQRVEAFLGKAPDEATMATLQEAAYWRSARKPGGLLRRLQAIKSRGWNPHTLDQLVSDVDFHYWL